MSRYVKVCVSGRTFPASTRSASTVAPGLPRFANSVPDASASLASSSASPRPKLLHPNPLLTFPVALSIHMNSTWSLATQSESTSRGFRPPRGQRCRCARSFPLLLGGFARQSQPAFCPISQFKTGQHTPVKIAVLFEGVTRERREITTYDKSGSGVLPHPVVQNGGLAVPLPPRSLLYSRLFPISRIFRNLPRTCLPNKMSWRCLGTESALRPPLCVGFA